jgi:DNA invertase Pin-like site-specific DNA recombinase
MSTNNSSKGTADRVVVYFRMSRDTQDKSIDRQRSEVLPHCQRQGYRVVAEQQDESSMRNDTL